MAYEVRMAKTTFIDSDRLATVDERVRVLFLRRAFRGEGTGLPCLRSNGNCTCSLGGLFKLTSSVEDHVYIPTVVGPLLILPISDRNNWTSRLG